jgi:hypothetical protein
MAPATAGAFFQVSSFGGFTAFVRPPLWMRWFEAPRDGGTLDGPELQE